MGNRKNLILRKEIENNKCQEDFNNKNSIIRCTEFMKQY